MRRTEDVIVTALMQHRCFICGGVLVVFHLCPGCRQLVHPRCECHSVVVLVAQVQERVDWRVNMWRTFLEAGGFEGFSDEGIQALIASLS